MRHLIALFLAFSFFMGAPVHALWAQDDSTTYVVTDVAADVTSDSAAHARDQAIAQAQRTAFSQLLDRLGANASIGTKLSDDDLSTLVKNFEVQNARTSSVRYIGTFTIQFKPGAVRNLLGNKNSGYTETKGPTVLIFPVYSNNGTNILWEDKTKWRVLWEGHASNEGLIPLTVPSGELEDIAVLSTAEAVSGKSSALKAMIEKYQAGGALVAVLSGNIDKPGSELKIDFTHYDADGNPLTPQHIALPVTTDKPSLDIALLQAIKQIRHQLEKDWQQNQKEVKAAAANDDSGNTTQPPPPQYLGQPPAISSPQGQHEATNHLPVVIPIASLAEWAQIKRTLDSIPYVNQVDVITLQKGSSNIEIEFHGSLEALQIALSQQNLNLKQDRMNGVWMLQAATHSVY